MRRRVRSLRVLSQHVIRVVQLHSLVMPALERVEELGFRPSWVFLSRAAPGEMDDSVGLRRIFDVEKDVVVVVATGKDDYPLFMERMSACDLSSKLFSQAALLLGHHRAPRRQ